MKTKTDPPLALFLFIGGCLLGAFYFASNVDRARFYQARFGPAVALACAGKYADPDVRLYPSLRRFLALKQDSFDCADLPDDFEVAEFSHWTKFQRAKLYLMGLVGLFWKASGVSWSGLAPLMGLMFGAVTVLSYALFRFGMGSALAAGVSMLFAVSPLHLENFPHYRDYSKTPFILAGLVIIVTLVTRRAGFGKLLGLSTLLGAIIGVGVGFRMDVFILAPFYLLALFLFVPGSRLGGKAVCAAAFTLAFALAGFPVLSQNLSEGSNAWHVALLGLNTGFDGALGLRRSLYEWLNVFGDGYVAHLMNAYSSLIKGSGELIGYQAREYDLVTAEYYMRIAANFPADMLARFYAVVLHVLGLPFSRIGAGFGWIGAFVSAAAALAVSAYNIRLAFFMFALIVYFSGYPFLQFEERHYFYLELIALWSAGFLLSSISGRFFYRRARGKMMDTAGAAPSPTGRLSVAFAFGLGAAGLLLFSLFALRAYQRPHLEKMFHSYLDTGSERLAVYTAGEGDGTVILNGLRYKPAEKETYMNAWYLRGEFDLQRCGKNEVRGRLRYRTKRGANDYTTRFVVSRDSGSGPARMFFPAFETSETVFVGIELNRDDAPCLAALRRVVDFSNIPLLLYLTLPPGWRSEPLVQTFDFSARQMESPADPPAS